MSNDKPDINRPSEARLVRAGDQLRAGRGRASIHILFPDSVRVSIWTEGGTKSRYERWYLASWPEEWRHDHDDAEVDIATTIASMADKDFMVSVPGVAAPYSCPRMPKERAT